MAARHRRKTTPQEWAVRSLLALVLVIGAVIGGVLGWGRHGTPDVTPTTVVVPVVTPTTTTVPATDGATLKQGCDAMTDVSAKLDQAVGENSWHPWWTLRGSRQWAHVEAMVSAPSNPPYAQIVDDVMQLSHSVDGAGTISGLSTARVAVSSVNQDCRQLGLQ